MFYEREKIIFEEEADPKVSLSKDEFEIAKQEALSIGFELVTESALRIFKRYPGSVPPKNRPEYYLSVRRHVTTGLVAEALSHFNIPRFEAEIREIKKRSGESYKAVAFTTRGALEGVFAKAFKLDM
jgi:hypothetical protein